MEEFVKNIENQTLKKDLSYFDSIDFISFKDDIIDFSNSKLLEANLSYSILENVDLSHADLTGANLKYANLNSAILEGVKLQNAILDYADLSYQKLSGLDLSNASLENAYLIESDLSNSNLMNVNLKRANLYNSKLNSANLSHSNLENTSFVGTDLSYANLSNAKLSGANFHGSNLNGTILPERIIIINSISSWNIELIYWIDRDLLFCHGLHFHNYKKQILTAGLNFYFLLKDELELKNGMKLIYFEWIIEKFLNKLDLDIVSKENFNIIMMTIKYLASLREI